MSKYADLATPEWPNAEIEAITADPETPDWVRRVALLAMSVNLPVDAVTALDGLTSAFNRRRAAHAARHGITRP